MISIHPIIFCNIVATFYQLMYFSFDDYDNISCFIACLHDLASKQGNLYEMLDECAQPMALAILLVYCTANEMKMMVVIYLYHLHRNSFIKIPFVQSGSGSYCLIKVAWFEIIDSYIITVRKCSCMKYLNVKMVSIKVNDASVLSFRSNKGWVSQYINSLRPSDAIWWHRTGSTLAQVMACCLTAPSHNLNQCWLIIN